MPAGGPGRLLDRTVVGTVTAKVSETSRPTKLTGHVWCDKIGDVHDDTLDPYNYGADDDDLCEPADHRPVYVWAKPSEGEF